jgi:hypothetical protein
MDGISQPVWTLIELIKADAEMHAVDYLNHLQKESFSNNATNSLTGISRIDTETHIKTMAIEFKAHLVGFVEAHICKMLRTLYEQIGVEEHKLAQEASARSFEGVEQQWFSKLYRVPVTSDEQQQPQQQPQTVVTGNQLPQATSTGGQQPHAVATREQQPERCTVAVVGPLGERPLHVCALSKYRFGAVDFEGQGNYFAEGLDLGIQAYINGVIVTKHAWKEVTRPYGKDYCAAVGDFIRRNDEKNKEGGEIKDEDPFTKDNDPPFWVELKRWYSKHFEQRTVFNISKKYSEMLVTRGLYEGETILLPFIAEHDERMVGWLLDTEEDQHAKEWSNSEDAPR